MGRAPCCDKSKVKRGPWSLDEDNTLKNYLHINGTSGNWIALPQKAGLKRCGKSCRLRWLNYLRPDIKHGGFTEEEDNIILTLYNSVGSRWSVIASRLQGRTDNDVKNHWNTKLKKKLLSRSTTRSTTSTTTISDEATFDISTNNYMHTTHTIPVPFNMPINKNETNYYENFQTFPVVTSNHTVPEMVLSTESTQYSFEYPTSIHKDQTNLPSVPISPSFSMESNSVVSWIDNNAIYQDGFFMDLAAGSSSNSEVLQGIDYQENSETKLNYPNWDYSSFFDNSVETAVMEYRNHT